MRIQIEPAHPADAPVIAELLGELLHEIMSAIDEKVFRFDRPATEQRAAAWLAARKFFVWLARDKDSGQVVGFIAAYEGYALYAEGEIGTISELFVRASHRSQGVGRALLETLADAGRSRHWVGLEVTTPPLPHFDRTVVFYRRQGFSLSGGRKMKSMLS
jgi:GNAT superfamily N-acetyltransferase